MEPLETAVVSLINSLKDELRFRPPSDFNAKSPRCTLLKDVDGREVKLQIGQLNKKFEIRLFIGDEGGTPHPYDYLYARERKSNFRNDWESLKFIWIQCPQFVHVLPLKQIELRRRKHEQRNREEALPWMTLIYQCFDEHRNFIQTGVLHYFYPYTSSRRPTQRNNMVNPVMYQTVVEMPINNASVVYLNATPVENESEILEELDPALASLENTMQIMGGISDSVDLDAYEMETDVFTSIAENDKDVTAERLDEVYDFNNMEFEVPDTVASVQQRSDSPLDYAAILDGPLGLLADLIGEQIC